MEYLSRLMVKVGEKEGFKFHDRCSDLKLNHLAFADDVLLFWHGDFMSILYMLQALKTFSLTSGLHPNASKTAIYCTNMLSGDVNHIVQILGFMRQELPFTYLGIPICWKKISGKECEILAERMTARIKRAVAWNNIFQSKSTGGLGIKNLEIWNKTAICFCLMAVKKWLNWNVQACNLHQLLRWIDRAKMSNFRKGVLAAAPIGLVCDEVDVSP
uniref:Reverse transcriptase domain-containing protein n=1 Tax=Cannabis sativa TaxID=3483 RepID=A0A803QHL7_CANSA